MTTTNNPKLWTVNSITEASRKAGSHWFDPDTMRTFGTKVLSEVYQGPGGVFFVTSDKQFDGSRGYTVRRFNPEGADINTHGELCGYTKSGAISAAKNAAGVGAKRTTETHREVTILEQFVSNLRKHGNPAANDKRLANLACGLIARSKRHHRMMEEDCNHGNQHDNEGNPKPWLLELRAEIIHMARQCGAVAVIFSGDPRGCTVKLTFADGYTDDFGREGYCVPTSLTADE